jgi:hypothetical protein
MPSLQEVHIAEVVPVLQVSPPNCLTDFDNTRYCGSTRSRDVSVGITTSYGVGRLWLRIGTIGGLLSTR